MTVIGVDYGTKRTGLAVFLRGIVLPLDPVIGQNKVLFKRLEELKERYGEFTLVLGLPLSALGKPTELSLEVERLAEELKVKGYTVQLVNEARSTQEARRLVGKKDRKGRSDSVAACEILKRHLNIL